MNRFKHILLILLVTFLNFGLTKAKDVYASEISNVYTKIEVNEEKIMVNEYVEVTFSIHNLAMIPESENGISQVMLYLHYDSDLFELPYEKVNQNLALVKDDVKELSEKSVLDELDVNNIICTYDLNNKSYLMIEIFYSFLTPNPLKSDGDIFTLKFKTKENVSGVGSFYLLNDNTGNYSYLHGANSNTKYEPDNSLANKEVKVLSNDTSVLEVKVKDLASNNYYSATYKSGKYEVLVHQGVTNIDLEVITTSNDASVSGAGNKVLINSNGKYSFEVESEDKNNSKVYEVSIRPMKSINTLMELQFINGSLIDGGSNYKINSTINNYTLYMKYSPTLTITAIPTLASGAKVYYNGIQQSVINLSNLQPGEERNITINVVAEDNTIRTYNIIVVMGDADNDLSIDYIKSDIASIVSFEENIYLFNFDYSLNNKVRIIIKPNDTNTVVKFKNSVLKFTKVNDEYISDLITLNPGSTTIYELELSANGFTKLISTRLHLKKVDENIGVEGIYVNDLLINDFEKNKYFYNLDIISHETKNLKIDVILESDLAIVHGTGIIDLYYGANVIIITVKSQTPLYGETQRESKYYLNYYRNELNTSYNDLDYLRVNGVNISIENNKDQYNLTVPFNIKNVYIEAIKSENSLDAILSGNLGYFDLAVGTQEFIITVKSSDGKKVNNYKLLVTRSSPSKDTSLDKVYVDYIELNNVDGIYYLEVLYDVNYIHLDATANNLDANISGLGWQPLEIGENKFVLRVSNFDKTHYTEYEVIIVRGFPSNDSYLSSLEILEIENLVFNKDQFTYSFNVPWEVLSLTIIARTNSQKSKILQSKNTYYEFKKELNVGSNQIIINVEAEDGTISNYSIIINRINKLNKNSSLKSLVADGYNEFDLNEQETETKIFNLLVPYKQEIIRVRATPSSEKSLVVGATDYRLNVGLNQIDITCFAEDKSVYTIFRIFVFREPLSNNNYLNNITIEENEGFTFIPSVESYLLSFDKKINQLNINVELADDDATYKVIGNKDLEFGNNRIEIQVTAVDGSVRTYFIFVTITKSPSTLKWFAGIALLGVVNISLVVFMLLRRKKMWFRGRLK